MFYNCSECRWHGMEHDMLVTNMGSIKVTLCPECRSTTVHRDEFCDARHLQNNKDHIFVFGDNLERFGFGGAAILRYEPNTYGFITKKHPSNDDGSYYTVDEYKEVFTSELKKLKDEIRSNPDKTYLISALGAGLANKYKIWEEIISKEIIKLPDEFTNVRLLFTPNEI